MLPCESRVIGACGGQRHQVDAIDEPPTHQELFHETDMVVTRKSRVQVVSQRKSRSTPDLRKIVDRCAEAPVVRGRAGAHQSKCAVACKAGIGGDEPAERVARDPGVAPIGKRPEAAVNLRLECVTQRSNIKIPATPEHLAMKLVWPWRVIPKALRIRHRDPDEDERLDLSRPDEILADTICIDATVQDGSPIID